MLGPTREKLLTSQRESLQDNDFNLDAQEATIRASLTNLRFIQEQHGAPEDIGDQIAQLVIKLAAITAKRANVRVSIDTVTDELGRTLKIRDAQSYTIVVPEDEEALERQDWIDQGNDVADFEFDDPDLQHVHKFMRNFENLSGKINFRAFFNKLFSYGKKQGLSHENYIQVIGTILSGSHYENLLVIQEKGLQAIVDFFMASVQNLNDPMLAHNQCKHFMRREDEGIRQCMFRYDLLLSKAAILFPNNENHDSERMKVLERSLGPKTMQSVETLQQTQIGLMNTSPNYDELLRVAERQEGVNGEFSNGIFTAYVLLPSPVVINTIDIQGDDNMVGKAVKRMHNLQEKTENSRPARRVDPQHRFYRPDERSRGSKYYRSNSGSRESSRERSERQRYQPTEERSKEYDDRLKQALLSLPQPVPAAAPQSIFGPGPQVYTQNDLFGQPQAQARSQQVQQSQPFTQRQSPRQAQRRLIQAAPFDDGSSESSTLQGSPRDMSPSNIPRYREPALMPANQDFNRYRSNSADRAPYVTRNAQNYQRQSRYDGYRNYQRDVSPSQYARGPAYSPQRNYNNQPFTAYRNAQAARAGTPYVRGNSRDSAQQGAYQRYRSASPQTRQRGNYPTQMGSYGQINALTDRSSAYWRIPGTHVPPTYDFKARPNHCTKCGGAKAHNGDVLFEEGHNDADCRKYALYNDKGCMICNALAIKAFHYESECRRNAGLAAPMVRSLN